MSRSALLICYYFPPLGLSGVARPLNLLKRLPQFGYTCHVLTVKRVAYRAFEPELLKDIDPHTLHRAGSHDPQRLLYLLGIRKAGESMLAAGQAMSDHYFPDSKIGWVGPAVRLGKKLIARHHYDVIISSSPPMSSHLVAMQLADTTRTPWVADFRDFWTSRRVESSFRREDFKKRGRELLTSIRSKATRIVATSSSIADYVSADTVLTNGFDQDLARTWRPPTHTAPFSIGLLGTFNDLVPIAPLLKLLKRVHARAGSSPEAIRLIQVGYADPHWLRDQLAAYGLSDCLTALGLQSRARTIDLLSDCHAFYIGLSSEDESSILPGRMFDLLASGRPILAHVPSDSEIAHLVARTEMGICFQEESLDRATTYLANLRHQVEAGTLPIAPCPKYADPYSWDQIARHYAAELDKAVAFSR